MQVLALILIVVLLLCSLLFFVRFARTATLILVVSPYQRDLGDDAPTILVAGDSTAYGTGALSSSQTIAGRIAADFPQHSVKTVAQNGATVTDLQVMLSGAKLKNKYAFVVLQIGANDVLQNKDLAQSAKQLAQILRLLEDKTDKVYIMTAGNIGAASAYVRGGVPNPGLQAKTLVLREYFMAVAETEGATYVDLYEDPATDTFLREPGKYLAFDGIHPNSAGYGYWYQKLRPFLPHPELK